MHLKIFRYYAITIKKLKSLHYQGLAALVPANTKSNGFSGINNSVVWGGCVQEAMNQMERTVGDYGERFVRIERGCPA